MNEIAQLEGLIESYPSQEDYIQEVDKKNSLYTIWFLWKPGFPKNNPRVKTFGWSKFISDRENLPSADQFKRMCKLVTSKWGEYQKVQVYTNEKKGNRFDNTKPNNVLLFSVVDTGCIIPGPMTQEQIGLVNLYVMSPFMNVNMTLKIIKPRFIN